MNPKKSKIKQHGTLVYRTQFMIVGAYISVFLNLKHHLSIVHFKICLVKILFPTIHDVQNVIKERTLFKKRKKKTIP